VLLWFAGAGFVLVWLVFRSPALDYRMVMAGAVLPVAEGIVGGPWILHTLVGGVALLMLVVLATQGRRLVRRRWIGLPIGVLLHLVLDGTFLDAELFWWPFLGTDGVLGQAPTPELGRSVALLLTTEVAGAACLAWAWTRFGLADGHRRDRFVRTGQLDRALAGGP
jgi:hypothetical protein